MIPSKINHSQGRLFESRLIDQLNPKHELYKLAQRIDWEFFEEEFETLYTEGQGQPPKPIRLMVGLLMLQQIYGLSDDLVVQKWVENPYWQFFCGYDFFEWQFPIDSSSLVRWRKRLGEKQLS